MTTRNAESMGTYGATWEARGYSGTGPVSDLIGSLAGRTAIIAGSADGVFEQVQQVRETLEEDCVIFGVNDAGMYLPVMDHWVSLHCDHLVIWKSVRWLHAKGQEKAAYHSIDARPFVDHVWSNLVPLFSLSGYFAMQVAWIMGCERIVLCGCPGSPMRKFYEAIPRADFGYGQGTAGSDASIQLQVEHEMKRLPEFKAAVRSMSGWTKDFFGGLDHGGFCDPERSRNASVCESR